MLRFRVVFTVVFLSEIIGLSATGIPPCCFPTKMSYEVWYDGRKLKDVYVDVTKDLFLTRFDESLSTLHHNGTKYTVREDDACVAIPSAMPSRCTPANAHGSRFAGPIISYQWNNGNVNTLLVSGPRCIPQYRYNSPRIAPFTYTNTRLTVRNSDFSPIMHSCGLMHILN